MSNPQGYPVYQARMYKAIEGGVACIRCGELLPAGDDPSSVAIRNTHHEQCNASSTEPHTIAILPELERLIPPLTEEEYRTLEDSLLAEGCRDALVVWKTPDDHRIIVDGHNRYRLCEIHRIPFNVLEREFDTLDDVKLWMLKNQLARRNLGEFARGELVIQFKEAIAARAKFKQLSTLKQGTEPPVLLNSTKREDAPINTRKELADISGTSEDMIRKVEVVVRDAPELIKEKARREEISTHAAYTLTKVLHNKPQRVIDVAMQVARDNAEKVEILARLFAGNDKPHGNQTFDEIAATGGFHYGDDLELWCDFTEARVQDIQKALYSLADHHRKLEMEARRATRIETIQQQEVTPLETIPQKFPVIYADPPWQYDFPISGSRKIENHYPTMDIDSICALPVAGLATEDAILFLWSPSPFLKKALRVMDSWGFEYRTCLVWDKVLIGLGQWVRQQNEHLLIGVRGNMLTPEPANRPTSVIRIERPDTHSEKPDEFRKMIERMYPDFARVELFARVASPNWYVWGNEV